MLLGGLTSSLAETCDYGWRTGQIPTRMSHPRGRRNEEKTPVAAEERPRHRPSGFLSIAEEAAVSEKCVPKNTAISTKWAVSNFECWRKRRNETWNLEPERQVPDGLLLGQHLAVSQGLAVSPISSSSQCNLIPL